MRQTHTRAGEAGFSLIELLVAMAVTLIIMSVATTLLARSLAVRSREDNRTDAIADVQRGLNIMSREIAMSGAGLPADLRYTPPAAASTPVPANGVLVGFCDGDDFAFVANLNTQDGDADVADESEAIAYSLHFDAGANRSFIVRKDLTTNNSQVLANRIDGMQFQYVNYNAAANTFSVGAASVNTVAVRVTVFVNLPAVGTPGSPGHQPAWQTQLTSEVSLRNAMLSRY